MAPPLPAMFLLGFEVKKTELIVERPRIENLLGCLDTGRD